MTRLFGLLGIDYVQWKALTIVALKMDLRISRVGGGALHNNQQRAMTMVGLVAFYLIMGGFASVAVFAIADVMLSATLVLSYLMFMVGAMVLIDHNSVITSPDDYAVLGFRPVSSRTYFAVRLANVFAYTLVLTTAFGVAPMVAFALSKGWWVGAAAVAAFYLSTICTTLALVLAYAWLLRIIGADRLKRALSYLQLIMGFFVYGGYFMMSQLMGRQALGALVLPDKPVLFLLPPMWFASYLGLAAGSARPLLRPAAAASLVVIGGLAATLGGRLSLRYSEELGALTTAAARRPAKPVRHRRPLWFRRDEARAVALLVRAQFRNDQKFRMGVLSVLPLTVLYVFMAIRQGGLSDPFHTRLEDTGSVMLVTLAILAFPTTLRLTLCRSDAYKASWIYFTSPVERSRLVRATKNVVVVFFLLPYLGFVASFLTYFIGAPVHVFIHIGFLGLVSHLFLQTMMLIDPELPFSQPAQKGTRSGLMFVSMSVSVIAGFILVPALSFFVYVSAIRIVAAAALLAGASGVIDWLTRVRVDRLSERLEFGG